MPSLVMVFCRKSTLLCRQLVRRSMVFSTEQISMPGTSCARAAADIITHGAGTTDVTSTIRTSVEIFMSVAPHPGQFVASLMQGIEDIIRKPHSRVEVCDRVPWLKGETAAGAINLQRGTRRWARE